MSQVIHVSQPHFDKAVLQSQVPVVVDFYANWCPPCRRLSPILDKLSDEFEGKVRFIKINSDEEPGLASEYNVTGLPTLIFFEEGEVVGKFAGLPDETEFRAELHKWVNSIEVSN